MLEGYSGNFCFPVYWTEQTVISGVIQGKMDGQGLQCLKTQILY